MAQIRLVKYEPALAERWDSFIDNSINGTLFHRQRFMSYHPVGKFAELLCYFTRAINYSLFFPQPLLKQPMEKKC